jgi:hypothetical protein
MKNMKKKEILKNEKGFGLVFRRIQIIAAFALLGLLISPLSAAENTGMYLSGFGIVTSAKNVGYNGDAPGVEGDITLLTGRIGLSLNGYYSTARKVITNEGYSTGGTLEALYRVTNRVFVSSGVKLRYYTCGLWEKKAYLWTVGVTYGFPEDLIQVSVSHAFKEHQTVSECAITTIEFKSTVFKGRRIGMQLRTATNIISFNWYEETRKTGVSGEVGFGILFHL